MKVQLDGQHLRLRIDEDELTHLLAGNTVTMQTNFAGCFEVDAALHVDGRALPALEGDAGGWRFILPEDEVRALMTRLPTRDGLIWTLSSGPQALELRFDVDVRDSARRMRDRKDAGPES